MITLPREEDLGPFVEILRPLRLNQTVPHGPTLRSLLLDASAHGPRSAYYTGEGPIPEHVCRQIQDELKIGRWNFYGMLYGTPAAMDAQWEVIREAFSAIPGARFYFEGEHDNPVLAIRSKIMSARPSLEATSTFQWIDNAGHVNFALSSPATGADALKQYRMARDRAHEAGKDYMGTFIVGLRDMQHVNPMMFDTLDRQDRTRTHELCVRLLRDAAAEGYGAYRTHPSLMDQVAATYSHNGNSLLRLSEKIKDALDPAGILAPGKQGIWPARFRGSDQPALIDRVPLTDEAVEWLGRVEGIAPVIEKFRDDAERDRHLSWQVFEALRGAGIHRMLISRKFGGSHVDLRTGSAVLQALAKLDPSVAWVMAVQAAVGRLSDYLAKPIARKIFKDQSSLVVGSVNPSGRAEVAAGGYRLSGTWAFASGSADADWLVCAAIVTEGGKPRGPPGRRSGCSACRSPRSGCWTPGTRWVCAAPVASTTRSRTSSSPRSSRWTGRSCTARRPTAPRSDTPSVTTTSACSDRRRPRWASPGEHWSRSRPWPSRRRPPGRRAPWPGTTPCRRSSPGRRCWCAPHGCCSPTRPGTPRSTARTAASR